MTIFRFVVFLAVMAIVTYLIRALPFVLVKRQIKNQFLRSFLYYVPYTILAAMAFPAILYTTESLLAGIVGLIVSVLVALWGKSMSIVAVCTCLAVLVTELITMYL